MPWIRYLYLHPAHVDERARPRSSDGRARCRTSTCRSSTPTTAMLRAMRRGVTRRRMAEIVAALREAIPGATLRTTVLVGFPGETEAAFETLLEFLDETRFDRLGQLHLLGRGGHAGRRAARPRCRRRSPRSARGWSRRRQDRLAWERQAALRGHRPRRAGRRPAARTRPSPGRAGRPPRRRRSTGSCTSADRGPRARVVACRVEIARGRRLRARRDPRPLSGPRRRASDRSWPAGSRPPEGSATRPSRPAPSRVSRSRWPSGGSSPTDLALLGLDRDRDLRRHWAAGREEARLGAKDPRAIVIDEVAGMLIACCGNPRTLPWVLGLFVAFRVFDVLKPLGINKLQDLPGGHRHRGGRSPGRRST